jgi:hypothetical protein
MKRALFVASACSVTVLSACGGGSPSVGESAKTPSEIIDDAVAAASGVKSVHVHGKVGGTVYDMRFVKNVGAKGKVAADQPIVVLGKTVYLTTRRGWFKTTGAQAKDLVQTMTFRHLIRSMLGGRWTKEADVTVQGEPGMSLSSGVLTVVVAKTGQPYPLEAVRTGGPLHGFLIFDDWNEPVSIVAPRTTH